MVTTLGKPKFCRAFAGRFALKPEAATQPILLRRRKERQRGVEGGGVAKRRLIIRTTTVAIASVFQKAAHTNFNIIILHTQTTAKYRAHMNFRVKLPAPFRRRL